MEQNKMLEKLNNAIDIVLRCGTPKEKIIGIVFPTSLIGAILNPEWTYPSGLPVDGQTYEDMRVIAYTDHEPQVIVERIGE